MRDVVVTGASGYIGRALCTALVARGHRVRGIVRAGREGALPEGVQPLVADALDGASYAARLAPADTLVQLVGTPHPNPRKAEAFSRVDLPSGLAAVDAVSRAGTPHLVYVSVAHPAPVMQAYIAVRMQVEQRIAAQCTHGTLAASVLRPWYVVGPGHWWPLLLTPLYALADVVPAWRERARRLGLVSHRAMVDALVRAVEEPPARGAVRVWAVEAIRERGRGG